jgi:hypothetical protein
VARIRNNLRPGYRHVHLRFENDELEETLEFIDWVGEYRLLAHLREKAETFQGIEIEN